MEPDALNPEQPKPQKAAENPKKLQEHDGTSTQGQEAFDPEAPKRC